jgi:hypothetical protein
MNLTMRDRVATLLVAVSVVTYGLWLAGFMSGLTSSAVALVVLVLGFLASASAVVPGFAALLGGSRIYLVGASLVGLVALASGVLTIVNATEETLALLVTATVVMWVMATLRHATSSRGRPVAAA